MEIPELRILKRNALDLYIARTFNHSQARARDAYIGKVPALRRRVAHLPVQVPYRLARSIQRPFAGQLEAIAVLRVDQARIEFLLKVAFDPGPLDGKIRQVCRALQHRARQQVKIHLRLEEQGAAHERALRNHHRSSAARCKMIDSRLDGLGVYVVPSARAPNFVITASSVAAASAIHADPRNGAATNNDRNWRRAIG